MSTDTCPMCPPRRGANDDWVPIATLETSTLGLNRNQAYEGACILVFDRRHVEDVMDLGGEEYAALTRDLRASGLAVKRAFRPDHMNYASLGNVVRHLHWHLIPRRRGDPRWGQAIWTTDPADTAMRHPGTAELDSLVARIHRELEQLR